MPTFIRNPTPAWMQPENASVFDSYWTKLARTIGQVIGADDPAGQVMGAAGGVLEFPGPGKLTSLKKLAEPAADVLEKAKALYLERGGGQSPARMAQALKDVGYKLAARTSAEKQSANAFVSKLLGEAHTGAGMVPESPFAAPAVSAVDQARALLGQIRQRGFDVDLYDDQAGKWLLSERNVSDNWRSTGGGSRRRTNPAAAKALDALNALGLHVDDVTKLINEP